MNEKASFSPPDNCSTGFGGNNQFRDPANAPKPVTRTTNFNETGYRIEQRVRHAKFGDGVITDSEGAGAHSRVQVNFKAVGVKWLVLGYANLEKL